MWVKRVNTVEAGKLVTSYRPATRRDIFVAVLEGIIGFAAVSFFLYEFIAAVFRILNR